jgi:hypothetical protein
MDGIFPRVTHHRADRPAMGGLLRDEPHEDAAAARDDDQLGEGHRDDAGPNTELERQVWLRDAVRLDLDMDVDELLALLDEAERAAH